MDHFELIAVTRNDLGRGAARRLRRSGGVPAVLYGAGKDNQMLTLEESHVRKQLEFEAFFSHILTVKVDGEETQAVLKALQRDPATQRISHMDLLRVSSTQEITMHVPLHFLNEETCPGKKQGGVVNHLLVDVEVSCLPKDLPEYIEVDMGNLDVGDSLHLSEVLVPEGVQLLALVDAEHDQPVVTVAHPQKLEEDEEEAEEGTEEGLEAAAEGEEGGEESAAAEGDDDN